MKVLTVDSCQYFLMVVRSMLQSVGITETVETTDPQRALLEFSEQVFDALLVDAELPGIGGPQFVELIRNHEHLPNRGLPIIMLSSSTDRSTVLKGVRAGVDEVLFKPVSALTLKDQIKSSVEMPRRRIGIGPYLGPDRRRGMPNWELRPDQRSNFPGQVSGPVASHG